MGHTKEDFERIHLTDSIYLKEMEYLEQEQFKTEQKPAIIKMGKRNINIEKVSKLTGKTHVRRLFVDPQDIEDHKNGKLAQEAFPYLDKHDREYLITGSTKEEWEKMFGKEE